MLSFRTLLCLGLVVSAALALPQQQQRRKNGGGGGGGKKKALFPFFVLDNPSVPCEAAIKNDQEAQEISVLQQLYGSICESKDENKHICIMNGVAFKEAQEANPDFAAKDVDLYGAHKADFRSRTVECKIALEKREKKEKRRQEGGRPVVFFRLSGAEEGETCVAKKNELIFPNGLEVGLRQEVVKECSDPPICILDKVTAAKIYRATMVTEANLKPLWNEYHDVLFKDEDPANYSWAQYKKKRGCPTTSK